jgi:serine/threonine-protein kinase SRK2
MVTKSMLFSAAPDLLTGNSYDAKKADLWSCGVYLYVMLYGRYPFDNWEDVLTKDIKLPARPPVSEAAKDLIRRVCVRNPDARLTLESMCRHPWVAKVRLPCCFAMGFYAQFSLVQLASCSLRLSHRQFAG